MRAEFAFFWIAAADQHEARRVADAETLAFHHVLARGGDVEQQVDDMVLEQVHFVDVEIAAIGLGQQSGFEGFLALGQGTLEVERADDPVFGCAQRQVDHGDGDVAHLVLRLLAAGRALGIGRVGIAVIGAAGGGAHLGEQGGQGTNGCRLAGAAIAEGQQASDQRIDGGQQQACFSSSWPAMAENG